MTYRPGRRHPVTRGAPGLALLAGGPVRPGERAEVAACRERGWAFSESEVLPGMKAVSAPVWSPDGGCASAVAVVFVGEPDLPGLGATVVRAALEVAARAGLVGAGSGPGPVDHPMLPEAVASR